MSDDKPYTKEELENVPPLPENFQPLQSFADVERALRLETIELFKAVLFKRELSEVRLTAVDLVHVRDMHIMVDRDSDPLTYTLRLVK